jgi:hypothetical protein
LSHQSQFSLTIEAAQCLVAAACCAHDDSRRWLKGCALAARADELNQVPSPCSLCSLIRSTDACRCRTPLVRTLAPRMQQVGARPLRSAAVPLADAARTRRAVPHAGPVRVVRGPRNPGAVRRNDHLQLHWYTRARSDHAGNAEYSRQRNAPQSCNNLE